MVKESKKKILVVSPHPDDETLGAGGTILKFKNQGHQVYWLNVTNMAARYGHPKDLIRNRAAEIKKVVNAYRFDEFFDLALNPSKLDEYSASAIIEQVAQVFTKIRPETVILPFRNDLHSDHRVVFQAVSSCTKVFRYPYIKKVLMMEILSETYPSVQADLFTPNYFIDISSFLKKKITIMNLYKTEIKAHPFPRSAQGLEALATLRGAEAGGRHAEGFMLLRWIE